MKVQELIDMLEEFDGDEEVCFSYNYGDHWRTTVAAEPRSVERQECEYSEYHQMLRFSDGEDDSFSDKDDDRVKEYVVIQS